MFPGFNELTIMPLRMVIGVDIQIQSFVIPLHSLYTREYERKRKHCFLSGKDTKNKTDIKESRIR